MVFDPENLRNTLYQIEVIFKIGSSIYIYIVSLRLNILVLMFIPKNILIKYHDKIPVTSF